MPASRSLGRHSGNLVRSAYRRLHQMASLSSHALEVMGFRRLQEGEVISATFHAVDIYSIEGITLDGDIVVSHQLTIDGHPALVAIGGRLNAVAREVLGDDFAEDEDAWATETKCLPPYLLVKLALTNAHECTEGHVKEEGEQLIVYDRFATARGALSAMQATVLPPLLAAVTCRLSDDDRPVRLRSVATEFFGLTNRGTVVRDMRVEVKATAYVSRNLALDELQARATSAISLAKALRPKVSRFLRLALEESDPLKRFLYFFLAIEVETHAVFGRLEHSSNLTSLVVPPARIAGSTHRFFASQVERVKTLRDRFVWCAMCAWENLSDQDVDAFLRAKKIRDEIAHGSIVVPPADAVVAVERLAMALHAGEHA